MPPETKWSHRNGTQEEPATARSATVRSAAHSAPATAPAPGTGPAPGSPAAAVHPGLTAHPGGTTTAIADAAGIGRPAACDALTGMETAGTVTRAGGGKPGIPDTWTLAPPGQVTGQPEPGPDGEHAAQPGIPAASGQDEPRRATRVDGSSGAGDRGWCHGRGRSVRQVSVALSIATAGAPAPVIA